MSWRACFVEFRILGLSHSILNQFGGHGMRGVHGMHGVLGLADLENQWIHCDLHCLFFHIRHEMSRPWSLARGWLKLKMSSWFLKCFQFLKSWWNLRAFTYFPLKSPQILKTIISDKLVAWNRDYNCKIRPSPRRAPVRVRHVDCPPKHKWDCYHDRTMFLYFDDLSLKNFKRKLI